MLTGKKNKYMADSSKITTGLGLSPLTEEVFYGRQKNKDGYGMWVGEKKNVTQSFLGVCDQYFRIGTIRTIGCGKDKTHYLHIKNDKESIEKAISTLTKMAQKLK